MGNKSQAGEMMWVFYSELGTALQRCSHRCPALFHISVGPRATAIPVGSEEHEVDADSLLHSHPGAAGTLLPGTRFTSLINTTGEPGLENRTALCPAWSLHRPMDTLLLGKEKFSITREPSKVGLQSTAAPRTMGLSPNTAATAFSYSVWVFGIWQRT